MPKKGTKNTDTGQVKQRKCATKPNPLCLSLDEYSIEVVVRKQETCVIPYLKRLLATNQLIDY